MSRTAPISNTIIADMKLLCVGTGDHIVSDNQLQNQYRLFNDLNIIDASKRDSLINAYSNQHGSNPMIDISFSELNRLFRENKKIMIIVENYASSNAVISIISFDDTIFINLLPTYNSQVTKQHACFVFEKEYFNGRNNMKYPPDSFGSVELLTDCRIILGLDNSNTSNDYCVIINAIDSSSTLISSLPGGPPPGLGAKIPPKLK